VTIELAKGRVASAARPPSCHEGQGQTPPRPPVNGQARVLGVALAASTLLLFAPRLGELVRVWLGDPNYSHGLLVPAVSLFFAWAWLRREPYAGRGEALPGLFWLGLGCVGHLAAFIVDVTLLDAPALMAILYGLAVLAGGRAWARGLAFPIGFLFFLFPLPAAWTQAVALWLQGVVSSLGTSLLQLGVPACREGCVIALPWGRLEVGEACSGLRQLIAFTALALVVAHLSGRGLGFRLALVAAAVPVAVVANVLRVLLMAAVLRLGGPAWLGGLYHDLWAVVPLAAGIGLLFGVRWWLGRLVPPGKVNDAESPPVATGGPEKRAFAGAWPALACLLLTLAAQTALALHLREADGGEPPGLTEPLARFPAAVEAWTAQETPPAAQDYYRQADDALSRCYVLGEGPLAGLACQLWVVHYRDGRDRGHHPVVCHQAAGFTEAVEERTAVPLDGAAVPVLRFRFARGGDARYVFYWHYALPAPQPDGTVWQRLHRMHNRLASSVTVEVFTPAAGAAQLEAVTDFVRAVGRRLPAHLPADARTGSELMPVRLLPPGERGL
jgi:exosortase